MKEIKTVIRPIEGVKSYDKYINELLKNGWSLKKRDFITLNGELNEVGSKPIIKALYAELERNNDFYFEEITL